MSLSVSVTRGLVNHSSLYRQCVLGPLYVWCLNKTDIISTNGFKRFNNIQVPVGSLILEFIRKLELIIRS